MQRLILKSFQSPGDIVMLTVAVRDLHAAFPGRYQTDVRTSADALWENNPYLTPLAEGDSGVHELNMHYPLVHQSNQRPYHFIHGYAQYLEQQLDIRIPVTRFAGDIHLSNDERALPAVAVENDLPDNFWIMVAGGKYDFTAKWWDPAAYQEVVDHFQGKIQFVQCGEAEHWHPRLKNVVDLVGKTTLRDFVRLMHHADGVVCPVTLAMHLAAAVETRPEMHHLRPCVVVAGGREPAHWEAYPNHQFISTNGALQCCAHGGCWKSRCQLVGDGDSKDRQNVCDLPVEVSDDLRIPQCMELITAEDVIRRIELYLPTAARRSLAHTSHSQGDATERVFLPYRGEFGHKLMWHVPWVHAQSGDKTVCCEPGEEALFPSAKRHIVVERKPDSDRREWSKYDAAYRDEVKRQLPDGATLIAPLDKHPEKNRGLRRFVPEPQTLVGISPDIVVCPRQRSYGPKKNWPHWNQLVKDLSMFCNVFAAGALDSSEEIECEAAWHYDRYLDATIEAMLNAKLVVATDAGLAHLAVLCGRPLLLITDGNGRTAPGYGPVKLARYHQANHQDAPIIVVENAWEDSSAVVNACLDQLALDDNHEFWETHHRTYRNDARAVCGASATPEAVSRHTERVSGEFGSRLPSNAKALLDYGCGIGRFTPFFKSRCDSYYGTDLVPRAIERAPKLPACKFAPLIAGKRIPFGDVRFDVIVTVTVLQHVVDDALLDAIMRQFRERTSPGARLVLHENIAVRKDSHYMRFRSAADYVERAKQCSFDVQSISVGGRRFGPADVARADELAQTKRAELHAFIEAIRI